MIQKSFLKDALSKNFAAGFSRSYSDIWVIFSHSSRGFSKKLMVMLHEITKRWWESELNSLKILFEHLQI